MASGRRSPNYPLLSLEEALPRVGKIYKAENSHKADREVIAKVLGYSSLNGTSLGLIGALNRYGLLEADKDGLKVSNDAVDILVLPEEAPERLEALQRCALEPPVFADLYSSYGENLPSDGNIRHYLVTKKNFLQKAADEVIRIYRKNQEFLSAISKAYTRTDSTNGQQQSSEAPMRTQATQPNNSNSGPYNGRLSLHSEPVGTSSLTGRDSNERADLKLRIGVDTYAIIEFEGIVTQEAIAKLVALLQLQQDEYPTKEMLVRTKEEATDAEQQPAEQRPMAFAQQVTGDE